MRVVSQKGDIDLSYENINLVIEQGYLFCYIRTFNESRLAKYKIMAAYKNIKNAKKAMDMVHQEWQKNGEKGYFKFPKDSEI